MLSGNEIKKKKDMNAQRHCPAKNMKSGGGRFAGAVMLIMLLTSMLIYSTSVTANALDLTFKYTVVQGTCELNVDPSVKFGNASKASEIIGQNWRFINETTFNITLTNCSGVASPSTQPAIKLFNYQMATNGSSERKTKIFTSSDNNTGLGVVLSENAFTDGNNGNLITTVAGTDAFINIGNKNTIAQNSQKKINAALACGSASDCSAANLSSGNASVNIQFAFVYH